MTDKSFKTRLRLIDTLKVQTSTLDYLYKMSTDLHESILERHVVDLYKEFNRRFTTSLYFTKLENHSSIRITNDDSSFITSTLKIYEIESIRPEDVISKIKVLLEEAA